MPTGHRTIACAHRSSSACATTSPTPVAAKRPRSSPRNRAGRTAARKPRKPTLTIDGHALKFTNLQQALLPGRRRHQARRPQLLRRHRGPDSAPPEGPPALAQTLPQRHQGAVLFSEGHARHATRTGCAPNGSTRSTTCSPATAPACSTWSTWAASIRTRR